MSNFKQRLSNKGPAAKTRDLNEAIKHRTEGFKSAYATFFDQRYDGNKEDTIPPEKEFPYFRDWIFEQLATIAVLK